MRKNDQEFGNFMREVLRECPSNGAGKPRTPFDWSKYWDEVRYVATMRREAARDMLTEDKFVEHYG